MCSSDLFIGPEVPYPQAHPLGFYKDTTGAMKRQAARFRIYGYNAAGEVVGELTNKDAEIRWDVHVANKKAQWYEFYGAMDIPTAVPTPLRNSNITGDARKTLAIDPGKKSIQGVNKSGTQYELRAPFLQDHEVYLGELRTDKAGRLIFLGGRGVSDSVYSHNPLAVYADNFGWHDDISDGPVTASVKLRGAAAELPVDPAWVVTAPPNYSPEMLSVQTLHDVMYDTWATNFIAPPAKPSFTEHILPVLRQFSSMQWVNYGYFILFGDSAPNDFLRNNYFQQLADPNPEFGEARALIFEQFRNPKFERPEEHTWPPTYGDAAFTKDPRKYMALTPTLYGFLEAWAEGNFTSDYPADLEPILKAPIEAYPIDLQPGLLDKAAVVFCAGGPFHPGCEMTWIMRQIAIYRAPYRIRPRAESQAEADYGPLLQPQMVLTQGGPLHCQGPGDLTRWMAVPWQGDTASCRAGYTELGQEVAFNAGKDSYLPTFWPARVPNHVLTEENYKKVMNTKLNMAERVKAFRSRAVWFRGLEGQYLDQINQMVTDFGKLGIIERRPGPTDQPYAFPDTMFVESVPGFDGIEHVPPNRNGRVGAVDKVTRLSRLLERR